MPLQLPNLDDRRYPDLVEEALGLIPTNAPEWTNHNPSDPGITLIELFAYLAEMMIYRLDRVTEEQKLKFLMLLQGPDWTSSTGSTLTEDIRATVLMFRSQDRAVTTNDFENLARAADGSVARARCVPRRDLEFDPAPDRSTDKPGHVSVVIVPTGTVTPLLPGASLIQTVKAYFEDRRLLTTVVHVVGPRYVVIGVRITLVLKPDALEKTVTAEAIATLNAFLHPLHGGSDGTGWPFGRNVNVSEIYRLLDDLAGVDYVTRTGDDIEELYVEPSDAGRMLRNKNNELVAIKLLPDELVDLRINADEILSVIPR